MGTSGSHTHTQLQGQMFTVTMLRHSGGPDMVEWPSQVKQMQSLWPEWMWHPEMWFTIILPCLFFQFISPLSSFLLLFPLRFFLLHLQHHLYLAPHFSFMFLFSALVFPLFFLFDPSVKAPLGRPSRSPCCYDRGLLLRRGDPWPRRPLLQSLFPFSASALSRHTASLLFICEHQFLQGSTRDQSEGNK